MAVSLSALRGPNGPGYLLRRWGTPRALHLFRSGRHLFTATARRFWCAAMRPPRLSNLPDRRRRSDGAHSNSGSRASVRARCGYPSPRALAQQRRRPADGLTLLMRSRNSQDDDAGLSTPSESRAIPRPNFVSPGFPRSIGSLRLEPDHPANTRRLSDTMTHRFIAAPGGIGTTAQSRSLLVGAAAGAAAATLVNAALWAGGRAGDVSFSVSPPLADTTIRVGVVLVVLTTLLTFASAWACSRWPPGVPAGGCAPSLSQPPCWPWCQRLAAPCRPPTTSRPACCWRRCTWSPAPHSW